MVWEPKSCFCGCTVKHGTLILGWLAIIFSAFNIANLVRISRYSHADLEEKCEKTFHIENCPTIASANIAISAAIGVINGLALIISILIVIGVNKNNQQLTVPYLVTSSLQVIVPIVLGLAAFIAMIYFESYIGAITVVLVFGLIIFLNVCLIGRVYYKKVKEKEVPNGEITLLKVIKPLSQLHIGSKGKEKEVPNGILSFTKYLSPLYKGSQLKEMEVPNEVLSYSKHLSPLHKGSQLKEKEVPNGALSFTNRLSPPQTSCCKMNIPEVISEQCIP